MNFQNTRIKVLMIVLFLAIALAFTYLFHYVFREGVIFTHFFYVPIILATLWWGRRGLIVPIGLSLMFISSHYLSGLTSPIYEDLLRSLMFLAIGVVVAVLSEEIMASHEKIHASEEKFRSVAETAVDGIVTTDVRGRIILFNHSLLDIFGYSSDELNGKPVTMLLPERFQNNLMHILNRVQSSGNHRLMGQTIEYVGLRKDGSEFPLEASLSTWRSNGESFFTGIIRDVTERKIAEERKNQLASIVESSDDAIVSKSLDGIIKSWNHGAEEIYGYGEEEVLGKSISILIPPDCPDELYRFLDKISKGEHVKHYETKRMRKDGRIIDISLTISPTLNADGDVIGASTIARDITQKKITEEALKKSLKDKEMLIKEIHHRVKNNLMIITSLLSLQSQYINDQESRTIFQESENRARSMAMIHEKLYQSGEGKTINFTEYIRSLGMELYRTYALNPSLIKLEMELDDAWLDVDTAIPMGLIFNELITNCLKHAFPDERTGKIWINFKKTDEGYVLMVADDGVGLPEDFDLERSDSFGLKLVNILTKQVEGQLQLDTSKGTSFTINFSEQEKE
ncbi:MAG: sensory histidine kinase AtoS [Methanobacterium sp. PtaU1.Bin242]|nr:MAG: sensory histidine kinase AtoS [Methanobacterium sp. PtaU1.Bin242]